MSASLPATPSPFGALPMKPVLIGVRLGLMGSNWPGAPLPARQNRRRQPHQAQPHDRQTLSPAQRSAVIAPAPRGRRGLALPVSPAPRAEGEHTARAWRRDKPRGGQGMGFSFVFNGVACVTPCCVRCNGFSPAISRVCDGVAPCCASRAHVMSRRLPGGALGALSYARAGRNNRNRHKKRGRLQSLSMLQPLRSGATGRNRQANKNRGISP